MQSYKTLITKRHFGRIKVRHIASASVGADICIGRCASRKRLFKTIAVASKTRQSVRLD